MKPGQAAEVIKLPKTEVYCDSLFIVYDLMHMHFGYR